MSGAPDSAAPRRDTDVTCAVCRCATRLWRARLSNAFFRCGTCDVLFRHPQPSDAALEQAYRTHYYVPGPDARPVYANTPAAIGEQVLRCLLERRLVPADAGRVLDLGCGLGDFAAAAMQASLDVDAVEPDRIAGAATQARGVRVYPSLDAIPAARRAQGYDLIALLDVLEHVREPVVLLSALRRLMRPQGVLYLSVPNHRSPQARILGARWDQATNPTHLFLFSPRSVARALGEGGFRFGPFPCVIRDPRFTTAPARLLSIAVQRLRLSATLRAVGAAR